MARILVTGAAGFIGSFLTERLVKENNTVIGVDNLFRGKLENIAHLGIPFFKLDVLKDTAELEKVFTEYAPEVVYHYAAINGTEYFYDKPLDVLKVNTEGTLNLLNISVRRGVKKFIFASSSEVYGDPLYFPTDEKHPILLGGIENPRYTYASGKVTSEFYTKWVAEAAGIKYLIFRIFNAYGPRMDSSRYGQVIPEFIRKMFLEPEFTIIGSGEQTRCFCYISDLIDMMVLAQQRVDNTVLNIGSDREITMLELAETLHKIAGREFRYIKLPPRQGDPPRRQPDTRKMKTLLGYMPATDLATGLSQTLEWYLKKPEFSGANKGDKIG